MKSLRICNCLYLVHEYQFVLFWIQLLWSWNISPLYIGICSICWNDKLSSQYLTWLCCCCSKKSMNRQSWLSLVTCSLEKLFNRLNIHELCNTLILLHLVSLIPFMYLCGVEKENYKASVASKSFLLMKKQEFQHRFFIAKNKNEKNHLITVFNYHYICSRFSLKYWKVFIAFFLVTAARCKIH